MANVQTKFSRLTQLQAVPGGGETLLLSPGVINVDFKGSLTFAANTLSVGDIIRVFAWGFWFNTSPVQAPCTCQVRLYFPSMFSQLVADTGSRMILTTGRVAVEWSFFAQLTVVNFEEKPAVSSDARFLTFDPVTGAPTTIMAGVLNPSFAPFPIVLGNANDLDLTGTIFPDDVVNAGLLLNQCSVEYLPTP
jgi:hypothetical protein